MRRVDRDNYVQSLWSSSPPRHACFTPPNWRNRAPIFLFRAFAFLPPFLSKLFPWPDAWRKVFLNASNLLTAPRLCVFQDPAIPVRTIWHNPKDHWLRYKSTLFPREERKTVPDKRRPSSLFGLVEDSDRAWPLPTWKHFHFRRPPSHPFSITTHPPPPLPSPLSAAWAHRFLLLFFLGGVGGGGWGGVVCACVLPTPPPFPPVCF